MDRKNNKTAKFNIMDVIIILALIAFISAAVYFIITGMRNETKEYKVAYTVRLELNASDADKISVGDSVLSSDGESVIGIVSSVKTEKAEEYVIDRRVTAAETQTETETETETVAVTTSLQTETDTGAETVSLSEVTDASDSGDASAPDDNDKTTAIEPLMTQIIIVAGEDHGVRTGELLTYKESEDKIVVFVTVIADLKAADNAYVIDGETVKAGKKTVLLTPYFYAEGEYEDFSSGN